MTELVLDKVENADSDGAQTTARTGAPALWQHVCPLADLEESWGEAALIGDEQIALFKLPGGKVHAVSNRDPRTSAQVMARGIVGSTGLRPTIASPLHKEIYDLETGECQLGGAGLTIYPTRIVDGIVEIAAAA
ncbi:nitrite reductase (NADH) small subunit [Arthrobacter sp. CAN_A214]|uniref:nitrite reductase small subunit NirD n=1 Tax=Arthrobacter sp. CAN_A214 TaxID=2787720 RepID=UPI0018C99FE4